MQRRRREGRGMEHASDGEERERVGKMAKGGKWWVGRERRGGMGRKEGQGKGKGREGEGNSMAGERALGARGKERKWKHGGEDGGRERGKRGESDGGKGEGDKGRGIGRVR